MFMDGKMSHLLESCQLSPNWSNKNPSEVFFSWKLTSYSKIYMDMQRDKQANTFFEDEVRHSFLLLLFYVHNFLRFIQMFTFLFFHISYHISDFLPGVHFFASWISFFKVTNKCLPSKWYLVNSRTLGWQWFLSAFWRY